MFIVAAVGWVLYVSLSKQQKHVLYMLIMFMDAFVGWVLDVKLSEQETCVTLSYFLQRHCWLLGCSFRTHPWNLNFQRSRTLLTCGSPSSDSLNNKRVLSGGYWILFLNPPLKFNLDKVEGRCWRVVPRCQNLWIIRVLSEFYFCSSWILATRLLFFNPPVKFDLIKLRDAADWSVPDKG
jgi:hypothetical protein